MSLVDSEEAEGRKEDQEEADLKAKEEREGGTGLMTDEMA